MNVASFMKVFPPPERPAYIGTSILWKDIEMRQKISLPEDYMEFIDKYGFSSIAETLQITNPFVKKEWANVFSINERLLNTLLPILPIETAFTRDYYDKIKASKLMVICLSTNGESFFWEIVQGHIPESWKFIYVDSVLENYEVIESVNFVSLIHSLLTGEIQPMSDDYSVPKGTSFSAIEHN